MKNNETEPYLNIYEINFKISNGERFTRREIDIIACVVSGRSAKKIASLLSIAPKTVENHIRNIMIKLNCCSQENIIDFIEKTGEFSHIRKHYLNLLVKNSFELHLRKLSKLLTENILVLFIACQEQKEQHLGLIQQFENHLNCAGIKMKIKYVKHQDFSRQSVKDNDSALYRYHIYGLSKSSFSEIKGGAISQKIREFESIKTSFPETNFFLLLLDDELIPNLPLEFKEKKLLSLAHKNYYLSVFELLKRIFPICDEVKRIFSEFERECNAINGLPISDQEQSWFKNKKNYYSNLTKNKMNNRTLIVICFLIVVSIVFLLKNTNVGNYLFNPELQFQNAASVRSDFLIPHESTLLNRPQLLSLIEKKFQSSKNIQTAVILGMGGSGKTTLARQFARKYGTSVAWEINAETKNSILASFENLAYTASKSPKQKKELALIQEAKDSVERENRLMCLVKQLLNYHSEWLLIYDNVDNISDITNFFPHDHNVWGRGRVIITTRDVNIANNSYISETAIIHTGELNEEEKSDLFCKIIKTSNSNHAIHYSDDESQQAKIFLNDIPSFPLDVSIAAYYIKSAKISFTKYLEHLSEEDSYFDELQKTLLKDMGEYNRTRHNIITLSLKRLLNLGKDFKDLLLLVALLDSQDIPKDLLVAYKGDNVFESLMHDLKKNSFVTVKSESVDKNGLSFSIHRSTQEIFLSQLVKRIDLEELEKKSFEIVNLMENYLIDVIEKGDFSKMRMILNHCNRLLERKNLSNGLNVTNLKSEIGRIYFYLGDYLKAKKLLEESLAELRNNNKKGYNKLAKILVHLGDVNRSLSNYSESQKYLEEARKIYQKHYVEDHPEKAWSLVLLGNVYRELGKFEDAEKVILQGLNIYRKNSEGLQVKIGWTLVHLGDVFRSKGEYEQAKRLYAESVDIHRRHYGENHIKTAWAMVYLGIIYEHLGQYQESKKLLLKSIKIYEDNFGSNHVGTAWALVRLGIVYKGLHDYNKSLEILNKSLDIHKKYYGENHIRTAWVSVYLANTYVDLKDYSKAKEILNNSLIVHKKYLGEDHIKISWISICLANVYKEMQEYDMAKNLINQSLIAYERHYGKDHIEMALPLSYLGNICMLDNHYEKAEFYLNRALEIFHHYGHSESYALYENLSSLYQKQYYLAIRNANYEESRKYKKLTIYNLKQTLKTIKQHFKNDFTLGNKIRFKLFTFQAKNVFRYFRER